VSDRSQASSQQPGLAWFWTPLPGVMAVNAELVTFPGDRLRGAGPTDHGALGLIDQSRERHPAKPCL
jgi:hypothetical protein